MKSFITSLVVAILLVAFIGSAVQAQIFAPPPMPGRVVCVSGVYAQAPPVQVRYMQNQYSRYVQVQPASWVHGATVRCLPPVIYCPPRPIVHVGSAYTVVNPVKHSVRSSQVPGPQQSTVKITKGKNYTSEESREFVDGTKEKFVTETTFDRQGRSQTRTYRERTEYWRFSEQLTLKYKGFTELVEEYDERLVFIDGVSEECYRDGWSQTPGGKVNWTREFERQADGSWKKTKENRHPVIREEIRPSYDLEKPTISVPSSVGPSLNEETWMKRNEANVARTSQLPLAPVPFSALALR